MHTEKTYNRIDISWGNLVFGLSFHMLTYIMANGRKEMK